MIICYSLVIDLNLMSKQLVLIQNH